MIQPLGHALSILRVPGDSRDRNTVLDVVGKLYANYPALMDYPIHEGTFTNPAFLELLGDYAQGDIGIATAMGLAIRRTAQIITDKQHEPDDPAELPEPSWFLDLRQVLTGNFDDRKFLHEPLLPLGRQIAIYAAGKTGKSLLMLEIACALATGTGIWGNPNTDPIHIIYADFEMGPADLKERLETLGYDLDHPQFHHLEKHLHYAQLQPFAPFDTPEGGAQLEQLVKETQSVCVIIDTLIRSVEGEENSADTIKGFYRYTGQRLKAMGVTTARVDHAGKDAAKGQRGTSAKRDDVDVVWRITANNDELSVTCEASRMAWLPQSFSLRRIDHKDTGHMYHLKFDEIASRHSGEIRWDTTNCRIWADLSENWDTYRDEGMSYRQAKEAFNKDGKAATTARFNAVLKYMRGMYANQTRPAEPPTEGAEK